LIGSGDHWLSVVVVKYPSTGPAAPVAASQCSGGTAGQTIAAAARVEMIYLESHNWLDKSTRFVNIICGS
jgi:hypothetical protein